MKKNYSLAFCISLFTFAVIGASGEVQKSGDEIRNAIASKLIMARQNALQNNIAKRYDFPFLDSEMQGVLTSSKNMLLNSPKYLIQTGTMDTNTVVLNGTMDFANLMAHRRAIFTGNGLIKNSFSGVLTVIEGDFIIESSTFHGETLIQKHHSAKNDFSVISYKGCFLDHLCVRNDHPVIIELHDTIVTGDIIFDNDNPGILVVDKKTVLCGIISNARVMMRKD